MDRLSLMDHMQKYSSGFSTAQQAKALSYLLDRRVTLTARTLDEIHAQVWGSGHKPYALLIPRDQSGVLGLSRGVCTCQAGWMCVHILAAAVMAESEGLPQASQEILPGLIPTAKPVVWTLKDRSEPVPPPRPALSGNAYFLRFKVDVLRNDRGESLGLHLLPWAQYHKKDGTGGRFDPFRPSMRWTLLNPAQQSWADWLALRGWAPLRWSDVMAEAGADALADLLGPTLEPLRVAEPGALKIRVKPWIVTERMAEPRFSLEWIWEPPGAALSAATMPSPAPAQAVVHFEHTAGALWWLTEGGLGSRPMSPRQADEVAPWLKRQPWSHAELVELEESGLLQRLLGIPFRHTVKRLELRAPDLKPAWVLRPVGKNLVISVSGWSETDLGEPRFLEDQSTDETWVFARPAIEFLRLFERQMVQHLRAWGLRPGEIWGSASAAQEWNLDITLREFLLSYGRKLMEAGIGLSLPNRQTLRQKIPVRFKVASGIDWFSVEVDRETPAELASPRRQNLGGGWIEVNGKFYLLEDTGQEQLEKLARVGWTGQDQLRIEKANFGLIARLFQDKEPDEDLKAWLRVGEMLKNAHRLEPLAQPEGFHGTLRDYQRIGFTWLSFLDQHDLNGCLADDMGLGKTVQALAFIRSLVNRQPTQTRVLLVAPVTTLSNWEREAALFCPGLAFLRHYGPQRSRSAQAFPACGLVIVSYATLRLDIELFTSIDWDLVLLDEAQAIKNAGSQTFRSVRLLKARRRLTLTGTPVENRLEELWSQMAFLNPGLLGTQDEFSTAYADNLELLKDVVYPFILRRKKQDVLKDLPDKEEITLFCDMDDKQRRFYTGLAQKIQGELSGVLTGPRSGRAHLAVLTALLRLRQACLYPDLIDERNRHLPSVKEDTLLDLLEELKQEDHKVLVFSQFTVTVNFSASCAV